MAGSMPAVVPLVAGLCPTPSTSAASLPGPGSRRMGRGAAPMWWRGLIAGEALCGLVVAGFRAAEKSQGHKILPDLTWWGTDLLAVLVLVGLATLMIRLPLANAGHPDEPRSEERRVGQERRNRGV